MAALKAWNMHRTLVDSSERMVPGAIQGSCSIEQDTGSSRQL
jgi:hypothetical protein